MGPDVPFIGELRPPPEELRLDSAEDVEAGERETAFTSFINLFSFYP